MALIVFVSLIACRPPTEKSTTDSTPEPVPTIFGFSTYTNTLVSPNQHFSVLVNCSHFLGDIPHCRVVFPNGNESGSTESVEWLPDNRHIVDTYGCFHDTPCTGSQIWDAISGKQVGSFYLWYQLSPEQTTIVYAKKHWAPQQDGLLHEVIYLSSMDLITEQETDIVTCPTWIQIPEWAGAKCE